MERKRCKNPECYWYWPDAKNSCEYCLEKIQTEIANGAPISWRDENDKRWRNWRAALKNTE